MEWHLKDYINLALFFIAVAGILVAVGWYKYALQSVIKSVEGLETDVENLGQKLAKHEGDTDAHVNHLYMRMLKENIDDLKKQSEKNSEKLDRIVEKLYEKK